MATDKFTNFCVFDVTGAYADIDTVIVVNAAAVSLVPSAVPFWLVWWDAATYSTPTADPTREIIQVDAIADLGATAELTIVRGQKGTSATAKAAGSKMLLAALADQIMPASGLYHRCKADGTLQFLNTTTGLFHTIYFVGGAGDESLFYSAGEA